MRKTTRIDCRYEKQRLSSDIVGFYSNRALSNAYSKIRQPELLLRSPVDNEKPENFPASSPREEDDEDDDEK